MNPITFDNFGRMPLYIGYRGENLVTWMDVDLSGELEAGWTVKLWLQRPGETLVYPKVGTLTGSIFHADFTVYDTANIGRGEAVIELYGADGKLKKSATTSTVIEYSLATGGGPPGPLDIYRTAEQQDVIDARKLEDAPEDGKQYARQDGEWTEITGGGGSPSWSSVRNKPFESIGTTMKVEDGVLDVYISETANPAGGNTLSIG